MGPRTRSILAAARGPIRSSSPADASWIGRRVLRRDALFGQDSTTNAEDFHASRNASVDRDLQERFADLVHGAAVADGAAEVQLELVHTVQRGEDTQVVEAALLVAQPFAAPDAAPA